MAKYLWPSQYRDYRNPDRAFIGPQTRQMMKIIRARNGIKWLHYRTSRRIKIAYNYWLKSLVGLPFTYEVNHDIIVTAKDYDHIAKHFIFIKRNKFIMVHDTRQIYLEIADKRVIKIFGKLG